MPRPGSARPTRCSRRDVVDIERGTDVVVAIVETHGRERTRQLLDGFEVVPRRKVSYRGAELDDLDLDAVLARRPTVALVDEMAHTNAPGSPHTKRWEDIEELLDAGIDVITTVNIQHLESLNDALTRITGVEQRETIPDDIVRRADQIELVDMAPEALRRRIVHGNVYPRERIDAALGNYFRVGNLSALRELALLWVADRVDDELTEYRDEHGISGHGRPVSGSSSRSPASPSSEHLIRRAARMAERSRAELIGVHVRGSNGLGEPRRRAGRRAPSTRLRAGRPYHEVVGDDPAARLVAFARAENATQLVLGTSRRSRLDELLHGSIINRCCAGVARHRRPRGRRTTRTPIPDHVPRMRADAPAGSAVRRGAGRARGRSPSPGRHLLTAAFVPFRDDDGLPGVLPAYMLVVVITALLGGTAPAVVAAVVGFTIGNLALTQPYGTLRITEVSSVVGSHRLPRRRRDRRRGRRSARPAHRRGCSGRKPRPRRSPLLRRRSLLPTTQ